jgi:hypothetical protein
LGGERLRRDSDRGFDSRRRFGKIRSQGFRQERTKRLFKRGQYLRRCFGNINNNINKWIVKFIRLRRFFRLSLKGFRR